MQVSSAMGDPFFYVKQHIERLNIYEDKNVTKVTFVVNPFSDKDIELTELAKSLKIDNEIIYREKNIDYSYGSWHEGILKNIYNEEQYFMFVEDDYGPCINNYTSFFLNKFEQDTGVVVQEYSHFKNYGFHAAISNGIISKQSCLKAYEEFGGVFLLNNRSNSYGQGENNQIRFLELIGKAGYQVKDIADISKNKFQFVDNTVRPRGNPDGIDILEPLR